VLICACGEEPLGTFISGGFIEALSSRTIAELRLEAKLIRLSARSGFFGEVSFAGVVGCSLCWCQYLVG